jgi:hypothetical protein
MYVGSTIWDGHMFPKGFNSNASYPNGMTLYYEALLWPPAVVHGLINLLSGNPVLAYNVTLLLFWALSGVCMCLFLREMRLHPWLAVLGALVFCLMPYRLGYLREFNMQICFGLPLFLFFLLRFMRQPTFGDACGLAITFWLQAVSELYQAVILLFALPFLVLAFVRYGWKHHVRDWHFYVTAGVGAILGGSLCLWFLYPYLTLDSSGFHRSAQEMMQHVLEPLSYLSRRSHQSILGLNPARVDETSVYVTVCLLVLAIAYGVVSGRIRCLLQTPRALEVPERFELGIRFLRFLLVLVFVVAAVLAETRGYTIASAHAWTLMLNAGLVGGVVLSVVLSLWRNDDDVVTCMRAGLLSAAVFCYAMSFGPVIGPVPDPQGWVPANSLFEWTYEHVPILKSLRVVSRFSIIVLIFLITAGVSALDVLARKRRVWLGLSILWLMVFLLEARVPPAHFKDAEYPLRTASLEFLRQQARPTAVLVLPMGGRYWDSQYMLNVAQNDLLIVNAWAGFTPQVTDAVTRYFREGELDAGLNLVRTIWPPPFVAVDRETLATYNQKWGYHATHAEIAERGRLVCEDDRFSLYSLDLLTYKGPSLRRLLRGDILRGNRLLTFKARSVSEGGVANEDVFVMVNGFVVMTCLASREGATAQVLVPENLIESVAPNEITLRTRSDRPVVFWDVGFKPVPEGADAGPDAESLGRALWMTNAPAWLNYVPRLPDMATPVQVHFGNGIDLAGVWSKKAAVQAGTPLKLRFYWRWDQAVKRKDGMAVFCHFIRNGQVMFQADHFLLENVSLVTLLFAGKNEVFFEDCEVQVPAQVPPGSYRIVCGLYHPSTGMREKVATALHSRNRGVELPMTVTVEPVEARAEKTGRR